MAMTALAAALFITHSRFDIVRRDHVGPEKDEAVRRHGVGVSHRPPRPITASALRHGHLPSISTSNEKLRKVRITTMPASTPTLRKGGSTATVLMMSPATRN